MIIYLGAFRSGGRHDTHEHIRSKCLITDRAPKERLVHFPLCTERPPTKDLAARYSNRGSGLTYSTDVASNDGENMATILTNIQQW